MAGEFEGKVIADRYDVGRLIASGKTGDLYHGRHVLMDKPEILKILPTDAATDNRVIGRFFEQAKAAGKIAHPNILDLNDFGTDADGTPYAVYEGAAVETLKSQLKRAERLPAALALDTARQAALALAAADHAGITHGGLSTENILVPETEGNVKIYDFASPLSAARESVVYSAPELFNGGTPNARSDVYSLGIVLYEMLAGEPPFHGDAPADVILKHSEESSLPLSAFRSDLLPGIEPVILKALAKDPDLRYQSADEFAADLSAAASGGRITAAAGGPANNVWKTAFIVLAGITLLSAFLIYATTSKQTDPTTALRPDANGQPVQPINPATGAEEQNLIIPGLTADQLANTNASQPPGTLPGGDGYDPWARGGAPPPGAPPSIPPGGKVYTIDPNNPSQFMPPEGGVILVPVPANTNTAAKPSPTPKTPPANANTAAVPAPKPAQSKPSPTPAAKTPASPQKKPTPPPKSTKKPGADG